MCDAIYSVLIYEKTPAFGYEEPVKHLLDAYYVNGAQELLWDESTSSHVYHFYSNGYPETILNFVTAKSFAGYEWIDLTSGERETVFDGCLMKRTFRTEMKKRLTDFNEFVDALSQVTHK